MADEGQKTLKRSIAAFVAVILAAIGAYVFYNYEWGGGNSPDACHCVELIEKAQSGAALSGEEMRDYQNCTKKYSNKFAAETQCWNERNKK
ncbi:MAG: hypothetical protein HKL88_04460 [Bacteroidia bacterium]|jgi:hypothetical protein|nr:hypothetical protein [Bacteroidia bacterium]